MIIRRKRVFEPRIFFRLVGLENLNFLGKLVLVMRDMI
jgi:hypothetical protein